MGQYFKAVLVDGHAVYVMDSWSYSNGAKQMEHSYVGNAFTEAVMSRIASAGDAGMRLTWVGDYSDEFFAHADDDTRNLGILKAMYHIAWHAYAENGGEMGCIFGEPKMKYEMMKDYVVENIDLGEYVRVSAGGREWPIHPVPLLCCVRGSGGGDYHGSCEDLLGRWAGDRLRIVGEPDEGSYDLTDDADFREGMR